MFFFGHAEGDAALIKASACARHPRGAFVEPDAGASGTVKAQGSQAALQRGRPGCIMLIAVRGLRVGVRTSMRPARV